MEITFSHPSYSAISSCLAIQFTEDVVIPRNREPTPPCITTSVPSRLPCMLPIYSFPYPMSRFMSLFISLCTNVPTYWVGREAPNQLHAVVGLQTSQLWLRFFLRADGETEHEQGQDHQRKRARMARKYPPADCKAQRECRNKNN